jgi:hypothetical protein
MLQNALSNQRKISGKVHPALQGGNSRILEFSKTNCGLDLY